MAYAETTKVPVTQTKGDIEKLVEKYKSTSFGIMTTKEHAHVMFRIGEREVLFRVPMPEDPQKSRARWRALLLVIKAKLESVDTGIETFEDAFLANIVMPDGRTVADHVRPAIESHYSGNTQVPLLPHLN